jgi:putative glutamine amidotransferase
MKVIALPTSVSKTQYYINKAYAEYVTEAGYQPLLVTPDNREADMLKMADGLLLPGGIDIDPIHYGEDNHACFNSDPAKDEFERLLFNTAQDMKLPIFGICRGFQLIIREFIDYFPAIENEDFLYFQQHVEKHNQVNEQQLSRTIHQHYVEFKPSLYGGDGGEIEATPVNSMHHQCLIYTGKPGIEKFEPLEILAWTSRGVKTKVRGRQPVVCEAYRLNWGSEILAVQWHPEELKDVALLQNFFNKDDKRVIGA